VGEARRREAQEPSYGEPIRGLIMTATIVKEPEGTRVHGSIDDQQLRYALLFWDKLVWPSNNLIYAAGNQDSQFLEAAKILERPRYNFISSVDPAEPFVRSQLEEFKKRDATQKGIWDLCQRTAVLLASAGDATNANGLGVELIQAIPVPDKDVPLNEILEFKRKRHAEFIALRVELDSLSLKLASMENAAAELQEKIKYVDAACANALRVCSEWQFPVRLSSQKMALDIKPFELIAGGIGGALAANSANLSATAIVLAGIGGAVAAAKSALKLTADITLQGIKRRSSPFAYVAHAHSELF
jgi:uncharacterized protein DUF6236